MRAKILFLIKNEEIRIKSFWFLTNFCGIPPDYVSKNAYLCIMILEKLSLINYKNIVSATLDLSPKINCLIGKNGVGKTNVLDAIYFLSFCHSASNPIDSQVIRHGQDFFVIEGDYLSDDWHKE